MTQEDCFKLFFVNEGIDICPSHREFNIGKGRSGHISPYRRYSVRDSAFLLGTVSKWAFSVVAQLARYSNAPFGAFDVGPTARHLRTVQSTIGAFGYSADLWQNL